MFVSKLSSPRRIASALLCALLCAACGSDDPSEGTGALNPGGPAGAVGGSTSVANGAGGSATATTAGAGGAPSPGAGGSAEAGSGGTVTGGVPGQVRADGGVPPGTVQAASPFPSSVTRPRIMIVGDSISAGPGCYKKELLAELTANGYSNFDFVGEYTDDCGGGVMHSARSCTTALDYTQPTFMLRADCGGGTFPGLAALMTTHTPDLLMLQLGVNDVWNGLATDAILANYSTLLSQARAQNPNIVTVVAQIQQIRPTGADAEVVFGRAQALIEAVPAWAQTESQATSPVFVADLWTNSDSAQTLDGVHPDDAGAKRMGLNWFAALRSILPGE